MNIPPLPLPTPPKKVDKAPLSPLKLKESMVTPSRTEKATVLLETEDKINQTFGEIQVVEEPDSGDHPNTRSTDHENMYYS